MIVDLPETTTNDLNKRITQLREEGGAITLGRVMTLVVAPDSEEILEDAIEGPCHPVANTPAASSWWCPSTAWRPNPAWTANCAWAVTPAPGRWLS